MNNKLNIYLAGPLFSDSEIRDRRESADKLRHMGFEVYNPVEQNDEIGFNIDELYRRDIKAMQECDFTIAHLDGKDPGTIAELGWLTAANKPVFSVWTNWKYEEPTNLFVRGLAVQEPNKLFRSFEEVYNYISQENFLELLRGDINAETN